MPAFGARLLPLSPRRKLTRAGVNEPEKKPPGEPPTQLEKYEKIHREAAQATYRALESLDQQQLARDTLAAAKYGVECLPILRAKACTALTAAGVLGLAFQSDGTLEVLANAIKEAARQWDVEVSAEALENFSLYQVGAVAAGLGAILAADEAAKIYWHLVPSLGKFSRMVEDHRRRAPHVRGHTLKFTRAHETIDSLLADMALGIYLLPAVRMAPWLGLAVILGAMNLGPSFGTPSHRMPMPVPVSQAVEAALANGMLLSGCLAVTAVVLATFFGLATAPRLFEQIRQKQPHSGALRQVLANQHALRDQQLDRTKHQLTLAELELKRASNQWLRAAAAQKKRL
jgi:hypothetical protein